MKNEISSQGLTNETLEPSEVLNPSLRYTQSQDFFNDYYLTFEEIQKDLNSALMHPFFNHYLENTTEEEKLKVKKLILKQQINQARDEALNKGVSFEGKLYQSSEKDRNLLTSTISLFNITKQVPQDFKWISKDNEAVNFTLEKLILLGSEMAKKVNEYAIKARILKDQVNKAKDLSELDSIEVKF